MEETSPENLATDFASAPRAVGGGELRLHEFRSRTFRNNRFLRVWVPAGYDLAENSGKKYPVFYLNDGQNLFESATSFTGKHPAIGSARRPVCGGF